MTIDPINSNASIDPQTDSKRQISSPFHTWVTCLYLILVGAVYFFISASQKEGDFLDVLDRPYSSFSRIFERDLLMSDVRSFEQFSWYDKLYRFVETDFESVLNESIKSAEELLAWMEKENAIHSKTLLRLKIKMSIFYAEAGRIIEFLSQTRKLEELKPEAVKTLFTAYFESSSLKDASPAEELSKWIRDEPSIIWSLGQLRARYLKKEGNLEEYKVQRQVLDERGKNLRFRYSLIWIGFIVFILSGFIIALLSLFRKFRLVKLQNALIPLPVSTKILSGILARSAFWGIVVMYGSQWIPVKYIRDLSYMNLSFLSALPMIYYVQRYLIRPSSLRWTTIFGLSLRKEDIWKIICSGLLLAFFDQMGSGLINGLFQGAGQTLHWSETVDDVLLFGKSWQAGMDFFDSSVSAPLFEEIACRGLLYGTLRRHFGFASSVLISGIFFSAIHFYSLAGFFEVLWSGIIWAYAYEKTRSLWPGIFSHALNNFLICLSTTLLYR